MKLQRLDWSDSCVCTTAAAAAHCQRALTHCWCGNGRYNELLQGYLCISPCHDCESCSANLIRWDTLLKMFSDFLHLPILCPQIDFKPVCWEEMISAFSSCRDFGILQIFESWFSSIQTSHLFSSLSCNIPKSKVHLSSDRQSEPSSIVQHSISANQM